MINVYEKFCRGEKKCVSFAMLYGASTIGLQLFLANTVDDLFKGNKKAVSVVICFASLYGIGLLFVIVNSVYLKCSRGHGSIRIGKRMVDLEIRRCCKIRSAVACNMLIIYHILLISVEIIAAVVLSLSQNPTLNNVMWILAALNYGVLLLWYLPCSMVIGSNKTHSHIGLVFGCNALELFHFLVFWVCAIFGITCLLTNCNHLRSKCRIQTTHLKYEYIPA